MNNLQNLFSTLFIGLFLIGTLSAQVNQTEIETNSPGLKIRAVAEMGFLAVLSHKVQFSNSGTYIDYVNEVRNLRPFMNGRFLVSFSVLRLLLMHLFCVLFVDMFFYYGLFVTIFIDVNYEIKIESDDV